VVGLAIELSRRALAVLDSALHARMAEFITVRIGFRASRCPALHAEVFIEIAAGQHKQ